MYTKGRDTNVWMNNLKTLENDKYPILGYADACAPLSAHVYKVGINNLSTMASEFQHTRKAANHNSYFFFFRFYVNSKIIN